LDILCIENKIVKELMNAFFELTLIFEFTKILGQFKQKKDM